MYIINTPKGYVHLLNKHNDVKFVTDINQATAFTSKSTALYYVSLFENSKLEVI